MFGAGLAEIETEGVVTSLGLEMLLAAVTVTETATGDGEDLGFSDSFETEADDTADTTAGLIFLGTLGGWSKLPSGFSFFGLPNGFEPSLRILGFFAVSSFGRVVTVGLGFGVRVVVTVGLGFGVIVFTAGLGFGGCGTTFLLCKQNIFSFKQIGISVL